MADTKTQTITIKYRLYPDDAAPLVDVSSAYRDACSFVSEYIWGKRGNPTDGMSESDDGFKLPSLSDLNDELYHSIRGTYGLKAQMAQSVMKTVLARYTTLLAQMRDSVKAAEAWERRRAELEAKGRRPNTKRPKAVGWTKINFHSLQCDMVSARDWTIKVPASEERGVISVNTLGKRLECQYTDKGYEQYRGLRRGTAKLVIRDDGKVFLHVPVEREIPDVPEGDPSTIVGVDRGLRFHAVAYDGKATKFHSGREAAKVRARNKAIRRSLQKRGTPSSRRRLKLIGRRENRWMHDTNSCIAKTLLSDLKPGSVIVMEDLSGVRSATEAVRRRDRYLMVSWPYYGIQKQIEYKAAAKGVRVVYVDPKHTSQTCPCCGNVDRNARRRTRHEYICPKCHYRTNDDRAAAMNIRRRGMDILISEKSRGRSPATGVTPRGRHQPPHDVTSPVCPSAKAECETAGIKGGRPSEAVYTVGQSQTPRLCPVGS